MSEYQFYEFRAVDRPLGEAEMAALRRISTRARITAVGFVNSYDWGDLKADPEDLVARYFDLFVYVANWGTRRFAMRVPKRLLSDSEIARFLPGDDAAVARASGANVVIDVARDEVEYEDIELDGFDEGKGWLDMLAPLRADVLEGDFRFLYLVWLLGVDMGAVADGNPEPLPGLAPMTPALAACAEFLGLDGDLVAAASAEPAGARREEPAREAVADLIRALDAAQKDDWLLRLHEGEMQVRAELRRHCRHHLAASAPPLPPARTAGQLRAIAADLAARRRRAEEQRQEAERLRHERAAAEAKKERLNALAKRGQKAWIEVDALIVRRNASGYEKAVALLNELCELALRDGGDDEFARRLAVLRGQHAGKPRFIERLDAAFGSPRRRV